MDRRDCYLDKTMVSSWQLCVWQTFAARLETRELHGGAFGVSGKGSERFR